MHGDVLLSVRTSASRLEHYLTSAYSSNKHIMIDLGTGNNNKM